ncbi:FAD-dependent monooxygenase [Actinomycetospora sp. TBRC 11914]|uniref:FAD-dependent oxidoreductase n=1 Tax=Actinomycetospora sp. TBRC 11914 TaxID=2729387 RepID=UPI00145D7745|nr:FAD-dependent monooxygenase [Actinomycetospora sp. TBRC 11914]NMO88627.1 FAD-dependent monooxygenase [Actinomycetospora sp. TBRC 11914]
MAEPVASRPPAVTTDVVVVGSGPAGAAMALALARSGVDHLVVTRYDSLAAEPRAHITNQRTMEVLDDLGVADAVIAQATPQHLIGTTTFCTAIAGEELGRVRSWGTDPDTHAAHVRASPGRVCDMPQNLMEPVLVNAATAQGSRVRYGTEYVSHTVDDDGVTVTVRDRTRSDDGAEYDVRARYLYGADGGRSRVAEAAGLPMRGEMGVAGSLNIVFRADLSPWVAHRPSVLYWVLQPGSDVGGIGMGLVRMVRPWNEWLTVWGYDAAQGPPDLSEEFTKGLVRRLVGVDDLDVEIVGSSAWTVNHMAAEHYGAGRVFCGGDAVHRHPPSNGLGSNTSIQDSFNLAWKLALVLRGDAGPGLLDSYSAERAPIGRQVVDRANRSIAETGRIFDALGVSGTDAPDVMRANMDARKHAGAGAEKQRRALREAVRFKAYEFDAHGVELNHRYVSGAVVPDDLAPDPLAAVEDPELTYAPSTTPGARLPHAWLALPGREVSSIQLAGHGRFTLFTAPGGEGWGAAPDVASGLVALVVVGPGQAVEDPYGDWAALLEAEGIGDTGAVLVRPDHHVAARFATLPADPATTLTTTLDRALSRT